MTPRPPRSTLSLHDALPIFSVAGPTFPLVRRHADVFPAMASAASLALLVAALTGLNLILARKDRKSTRLNSSHVRISYAVFCLKKKNNIPLAQPITAQR